MAVVVVVDDEFRQQTILKTILEDEGYEVHTASSAEEGVAVVESLIPDVVITDLKMSGKSGIHLLDAFADEVVKPAVIIMTAHGTISSAVEAMQKGAFDYLTKPLDKNVIVLTVRKAVERMRLLRENLRLQQELFERFRIEGIVGSSEKMRQAIAVVMKAAPTSVTVLVQGESGTGKELIARAIHYNSARKTGPFTAINCAAIPDNLIESELFGYEPGAFTGATHRKIGLFESSNGGTLFLDEIGDLPLLTQTKLLRVLQDKEVRRIGGKESNRVDVRIITATNKELDKEVRQGKFREDLFYRLRVVVVTLPPLRERREDIPSLASFFIEKYNKEFGKKINGLSDRALKALMEYHWPGNIRQLESVMERAVLMSEKDTIDLMDIKSELQLRSVGNLLEFDLPDEGINFEEFEKSLIRRAMEKSNNVAARAARLLGMSYKTFWYRLEKFGLNVNAQREETPPEKNA